MAEPRRLGAAVRQGHLALADAGSAEFTWQQAGWTFALNVPEDGEAYQLRAVAEMKLGSGQHRELTTGTCTVGG